MEVMAGGSEITKEEAYLYSEPVQKEIDKALRRLSLSKDPPRWVLEDLAWALAKEYV